MIKRIFVADVMTRKMVSIKPDTNLLKCAKLMLKKNVGSLLLVEKKRLVGLILQRDILWAFTKKSREDLKNVKAIDISPRKLATIKPTATIEQALHKMKKLRFERLPVIKKGELAGMLTIRDILNFHPEVYPELDEFAQIKEETRKLKRVKKSQESNAVSEGICEECGNTESLYRFNGMLVCDDCCNEL